MIYINVWQAKDGSYEAGAFKARRDVLEEIGAEYPGMRYVGTVTLHLDGKPPLFEDLSEEAHQAAMDGTADWLADRRAYLARVL